MKKLLSLAAPVLFASLPLAGHADTFKYAFTLSEPVNLDSGNVKGTEVIDFTYTSPFLINSETVVTADTTYYYSAYDGAAFTDPLKISFNPFLNSGIGGFTLNGEHLSFGIAFGSAYPYQSAFTVGDHPCGKTCDWDIVDVPSATSPSAPGAAPVPEPSTFALLGTGILGSVGFVRRRFR